MPRSSICVFLERRFCMDNIFMLPISVEKYAAFLDENLSSSEMDRISAIIEMDSDLQQINSMSHIIDEDIAADELLGYELPDNLKSLEFDIPDIDDNIDSDQIYFANHSNVASDASEEASLPTNSNILDSDIHEDLHIGEFDNENDDPAILDTYLQNNNVADMEDNINDFP